MGVVITYGKGVYLTLCALALQSLANLKYLQRQSNSRCPNENMYPLWLICISPLGGKMEVKGAIHIFSVGFCVARSSWYGQCETP